MVAYVKPASDTKTRFLPARIQPTHSRIPAPPMHAYVYKSLRKADTYVYLAEREDFERLPEPLRAQLEPLRFVLDVVLTPERKLAREDAATVRENLVVRGFHLQLPPGTDVDPMTQDWGDRKST